MIEKSIDNIIAGDLYGLIENGRREIKTLEYKKELPGNSDEDRKEFLADVSSFANSSGGDILYGIEAEDGIPTNAKGLSDINIDVVKLRLESMIRDGISPRVPGIAIREVDGLSAGPAILIRIYKSHVSPHMVVFKNTSKFFARNSAGKYQLDVGEIRTAFSLSEALPEKIRQFRLERISKVIAGETPVPLPSDPKYIFHVVPISSFSLQSHLNLDAIFNERFNLEPKGGPIYRQSRINFDGIASFCKEAESHDFCQYSQTFRKGIIETVSTYFTGIVKNEKLIASKEFETQLITVARNNMRALKNLEIAPPIVFMLSLVGIMGYRMNMQRDSIPIERDVLIIPENLIDSYDVQVDVILKPSIDAVWNASGMPASPYYNEQGRSCFDSINLT